MTVLLTRNFEDNLLLAEKIKTYGIDIFIEPMFEIDYLSEPSLNVKELISCQAIIFTSKNALNAIKKISSDLIHLKCFVVGDATAKLAKELKFRDVYVAANNAKSLLDLILSKCCSDKGRLLYFCGEKLAFDLQEALVRKNYAIEKLVVYRVIARDRFSGSLKAKIIASQVKIVLLFSLNTTEIFLKLIKQNNLVSYLRDINLFVISKKLESLVVKYNWHSVFIFDVTDTNKIVEKIRCYYE